MNRLYCLIFFITLCSLLHGQITFLTQQQAQKAIIDETVEPYFSLLQSKEMVTKTGKEISGSLEEQRKECRKRYQEAVLEFSEAEQQAITGYVEKLLSLLKEDYPFFYKTPWNFLKLNSTIEGGLPHTRGKHIIFAPSVARAFVQMKNHPGLFSLLVHEQMHVIQRLYPEKFSELYTKHWGFVKGQVTNHAWLDQNQLKNPDGVDCSWIFPIEKDRWVLPLIILKDIAQPKMPNDMLMVGVELQKEKDSFVVKTQNDVVVMDDLLNISEYRTIFPKSANTNIYHPNEAGASVFSQIVVFDYFYTQHMQKSKTKDMENELKELRKLFKEAFAG